MTSKAKPSRALRAASPSGGFGDLEAGVRKSFSYNTSQRFLVVYEEEVRHGIVKVLTRFTAAVKATAFGLHT